MTRKYPAIPQPTMTVESLQASVLALKELVEILARQRVQGVILDSAVTWRDLVELNSPIDGTPLIDLAQVPRK